VSAPQYPGFEVPPGDGPQLPDLSRPPASRDENPPWSGWDVLGLALLTIFFIVVFLFAITLAAQRLVFAGEPPAEVAKYPLVVVTAQLLAYIAVLAVMVLLVKRGKRQPFWPSIRWNWPRNWTLYLFGGVVLALALQGLAHLLPMPKELPIDRFFQTPLEAWVVSLFGVTFAPLLEELFFRGFLYPVLVRRLGMVLAVILTAAGFGLIHAPQLGRAWAPVLVVFLVGLTLTITRAVTKSVAAGVLIHIAYNGTISVLIFLASDGFRHLEKLNQ
jgi:CAAX protease family protein